MPPRAGTFPLMLAGALFLMTTPGIGFRTRRFIPTSLAPLLVYFAVAAGPDNVVYVATCDLSFGGVIDVVDARTMRVVSSIDVGGLVTDLVAGAAGDRLYVAGVDRVSVVCVATQEIIDTVTIVDQPSCLAESADGKKLFIADYDGAVTALTIASNTESLLARMLTADSDAVLDIPMLELESAGI